VQQQHLLKARRLQPRQLLQKKQQQQLLRRQRHHHQQLLLKACHLRLPSTANALQHQPQQNLQQAKQVLLLPGQLAASQAELLHQQQLLHPLQQLLHPLQQKRMRKRSVLQQLPLPQLLRLMLLQLLRASLV
jgi:hypothetical protein